MAMSTMSAMTAGALTWGSSEPATHGVQEGTKTVSMPIAVPTVTMMNLF
jgi:hypothetical protein